MGPEDVQESVTVAPVRPDYDGASLARVIPALLAPAGQRPAWIPAPAATARQVVILVVDGLGWQQLRERPHVAPTLAAMTGGPITSVAPTTTATALTSIATGRVPAEHGLVGFRLRVLGADGADEVLNVLRWRTPSGDARQRLVPGEFQPVAPFGGRPVPAISRYEFSGTGFTDAHLRGSRLIGYAAPSAIAVEVGRALDAGEELVYAYYDGLDKTAHATGLGDHYDAELAMVDHLVDRLIDRLPAGAALVVTADHGQVDVGTRARTLPGELAAMASLVSGEARFRWLHAGPAGVDDLLAAAREWCGERAWVHTVDELDALGWYGGHLDDRVRSRLGDVAMVATGDNAIIEGRDPGESRLVCMHGSLTAEEMHVPLVAAGR